MRVRLLVLIAVGFAALLADGAGSPTSTRATVPGDNGKIAFSRGSGNVSAGARVYVMEPDGTGLEPLTDGGTADYQPAWSPDGDRIAFVRIPLDAPANSQIWVMNADGSNQRFLAGTGGGAYQAPAWSPDGEQIVFFGYSGLQLINSDGTNLRTLLPSGALSGQGPVWSPDGSRIAFTAFDFRTSGEAHVGIGDIAVDGSGFQLLVETTPQTPTDLDWSPDGGAFTYFAADAEAQEVHIYKWTLAGSTTTDLGIGAFPAFSPDGEKIVFAPAEGSAPGIAVMDADGGGRESLTSSLFDLHPAWQPKPEELVDGIEFTQAIQELQSIGELQSDLQDDGQPPVPIIAGKPAVMRIYFREVETEMTFNLEVAGHFAGVRGITLTPGCTPEDRRRQRNNCTSVDYYFTPPEGAWSVSIRVLDDQSQVVEEHNFDLTSPAADKIVLKAVSVCDSTDSGGVWQCGNQADLARLASLARHIFPTASLRVDWTAEVVRNDVTNTALFPRPIDWWGKVDRDLAALYDGVDLAFDLGSSTETYYYGITRNSIPGGVLGAAYLNSRGAASKTTYSPLGFETIQWVVAHEAGHAMGADHTNTAAPPLGAGGCWLGNRVSTPPYPYSDNLLRSGDAPGAIEVGFDVANQVALPGDNFYEVMGYCVAIPPVGVAEDTAWITPFSTMELLEEGGGPLQADRFVSSSSVAGDFWLLRGLIPDLGAAVEFEPLVTLQTEGLDGSGAGPYKIEVRDGANGLLFTRSFDIAHGHGSPEQGEEMQSGGYQFTELVPVQAAAATITVLDPFQTIIGELALGGLAPSVESITLPPSFSGVGTVSWSVTDGDSTAHTFRVDYSPDGRETWINLGQSLTGSEFVIDFSQLPAANAQAQLRVIASDGVNSGEGISASFSLAGHAPHAEIIGPSKISFHEGDLVWLEAAAFDVDDGSLDDGAVTWSSSRDGNLGSGASLPVYDLSAGTHTITMTGRDSDNNTATDSITITVASGPIVEGGSDRIWGDVKCDGNVNLGDSIALARKLVSLDPGQSAGCPEIGATVSVESALRTWGDVDCGGSLGLGDAIALARFLVGIVPNIAGCPTLGSTVKVQT